MPHNIEKSAFRAGEYIGYANGVWHILKPICKGDRYIARNRDNPNIIILAHTLKTMSRRLEEYSASTEKAA